MASASHFSKAIIIRHVGAPSTTSEALNDDKPSNNDAATAAASDSDSSDSVTFVTSSPGMAKRQRNFRNTKIDRDAAGADVDDNDDDDDDVVEVIMKSPPMRSRSHSRTRCVKITTLIVCVSSA